MKNKEYWIKRALNDEEKAHKSSLETHKKQVRILKNAENEIKKIIENYLYEISRDNKVSIIEAQRILDEKEKEELNWILKDYILYSKEYEKYINKNSPEAKALDLKLKNASRNFRIKKNEAMLLEIQKELVKLGVEQNKTLEKHLENTIQETRKDNNLPKLPHKEEIKPETNNEKNKLSENFKTVEEALNENWVGDKNFSQRIWKDVHRLKKVLEEELPKSISRGDGGKTLIDKLEHEFEVSKNKAKRLVLTESARIYSKTRIKSMLDLGVDKVELLATLDMRTSVLCQERDHTVVELKGSVIGIDLPPFHPYCRTTFVALLNEELEKKLTDSNGRKARDPITNKSYTTGAKDYKKWIESKAPDVNEKISKVHHDRYLDKHNYKKMKKLMKNDPNFPKTLAEYRKLRYNDVDKHKRLLDRYENKKEHTEFQKMFNKHKVPKEYIKENFEEYDKMKQGVLNGIQQDILDYEKHKFRYNILKKKELSKRIRMNKGSQHKHMLNSKEYKDALTNKNNPSYKSYLEKNGTPITNKQELYDYTEELYREAAGKGEIKIKDNNGVYEYSERYKFNKEIGKTNKKDINTKKYSIPPDKSNYVDTNVIEIKYSKKGYHIYPKQDI